MASIVPGYENDIFISYRQKDNKYDGWVTEFVGNLRKELEATFKEDITIYFDENPHDGLLDHHDVNRSLEGKLNCLVFLPIISQTYCDPRSFAWQFEFKRFAELTRTDTLGQYVELQNGNQANRILPIIIHQLDAEDENLLESVLQTKVRGIDFTYRSPGINRPLTPADTAHEHAGRTTYRNQLNKTANAIKDLVRSIQH